jgi:hypothetical protein
LTVTVNLSASQAGVAALTLAPRAMLATLLLLPFAGVRTGSRRHLRSPLAMGVLAIGLFLFSALSGCGSGATSTKTFQVNLVGTSNAIQHSATVTVSTY